MDVCDYPPPTEPPTTRDCSPKRRDYSCCSNKHQCGEGGGDCDSDEQCLGNLICVDDAGAKYGGPASMDVCEAPPPTHAPTEKNCNPSNENFSCCTRKEPCGHGGGDCDSDAECEDGMVCSDNV